MSSHVLKYWQFYLSVAAFAGLLAIGTALFQSAGLAFLVFISLIFFTEGLKLLWRFYNWLYCTLGRPIYAAAAWLNRKYPAPPWVNASAQRERGESTPRALTPGRPAL